MAVKSVSEKNRSSDELRRENKKLKDLLAQSENLLNKYMTEIEILKGREIQTTHPPTEDPDKGLVDKLLKRSHLMLSSMYLGILLIDDKERVEFINQAFCDYYDLKGSPEDFLGLRSNVLLDKIINVFPEPVKAKQRIFQIISEGKPVKGEEFQLNGGRIAIRDFIPLDGQEILSGRLWIHLEITQTRKTEDALTESEKKFTTVFNAAPTAMSLSSIPDGKIIEVNQAWLDLMKIADRKDIIGKTSVESGLFSDISTRTELVKKIQNLGTVSNTEVVVNDHFGNPLNLLINVQPIELSGRNYLLSTNSDITELKKATRELRKSEARFRKLIKYSPAVIYEMDQAGTKFISVNDTMCDILGYSREELFQIEPRELLDEPSKHNFQDRIRRREEGKAIEEDIEYHIRKKNGEWIYALITVGNISFSQEDSSIITVIAYDITERKKMESAIRESEQHLKYHLENSPLAVIEWDKDFRIIQWSTEAERLFGLKKEEVINVPIIDLNIIYEDDMPLVENTINRLLGGKEIKVTSRNRNYGQNREILECVWYNSVLLDDNQEMKSVLSLVQDITKLRKTEDALLESRESYKELVTNARSMIVKLDNDGNFTFINDYFLDFFGYEPDELLGKSVMLVVPKTESLGKMVDDIVEDPDSYQINVNENIKKSGEIVWVEWHNKTLFDKNGKKTGHIAIGIDITERKITEEKLKESEKKLKSVLNATLESIYMFDRKGNISMTNATGLKRLNCSSEEEVIGRHFSEFMSQELAQTRQTMTDMVIKNKKPIEFEDTRDGRIYHHSFSPVLNGDEVSFIVTYSTDITERKNSEIKLKHSENRLRSIAESLTALISIVRVSDSVTLFVNEPYLKKYGYSLDELIGKKDPDNFVYPEDRDSIRNLLNKYGYVNNREVRVKDSDGKPFWIITSIRKLIYMGDVAFITSSTDITETKNAQEELLRLNRTLNAHNKSSHVMLQAKDEFSYLNSICKIIIQDCGYTMVWVGYAQNDEKKTVSPVAFYGMDKGYIDQMNISWDDSDRGRGPTGTAIRTCRPSICKDMENDPRFAPWKEAAIARGYSSSLVLPLITEGKAFGAVTIYSKEKDSFIENEIDLLNDLADDMALGISYLRLAESERAGVKVIKENEIKLKELIETKDKFFNIVAHDLKNPFTSLLGSTELLYENINQMTTDNIKELALILNDSAKSGYAILQNLLDWSRSQTGQIKISPKNLNLRSLVDQNIDNLKLQSSSKQITIKSEITSDIFVYADENMINTVLRNLLSNAVKFTYRKGLVTVKVETGQKMIRISVSDNGIGMTKSKIDTLFRLENSLSMPGTEKEHGTGLGLKLCKEFTDLMGGEIWAESEPYKGSKFIFTLPTTGKPGSRQL
jgi:PAS domain S-box-containing protein